MAVRRRILRRRQVSRRKPSFTESMSLVAHYPACSPTPRAFFYADLYRYTPPSTLPTHSLASTSSSADASSSAFTASGTWRHYSSPNQPGPRSAHQVVADPRQGGLLWLFGGEFASPKQTSFHHYRDLWVFSIATKTWERVDTKVRPSARSGHRMVLWRQYLVLFGGFIDTGARTTYLQDLWMFDTAQYKWFEITQNDLKRPPARSGFSLISTPEGVALYGGYCKRYVKGQRTQGESERAAEMTMERGKIAH